MSKKQSNPNPPQSPKERPAPPPPPPPPPRTVTHEAAHVSVDAFLDNYFNER